MRLRSLSIVLPLFVVGCFHGDAKPTTPAGGGSGSAAAPTEGALVISETAIGPVDASTPATLDGLRTKLAGYDVKAVRDENDYLQYDAYKDGVLVMSIAEDNGKILNVMTTDPKVTVASHPTWHAGAMFTDAKQLSRCDCWGGKYVCWKDGEHVAAAFDRSCKKAEEDPRALVVLDGTSILRLVWNPQAFGKTAASPTQEKPRGGGLGGKVQLNGGNGARPNAHDHDDDDDDDDGYDEDDD